jgi:hypothetical protein
MAAVVASSVAPSAHRRITRWSAALGLVAWLAALPLLHGWAKLDWAEAALLFAALVILPLGLGLIEMPSRRGREPGVWRWAVRCQFPAALLLVASPGCSTPLALALSAPYLLATVLAALAGVWRFVHRRSERLEKSELHEVCLEAALVYLPGGAVWHLLGLLDVPLLGFEPIIVRLTAVHLHYVGFALPLLTGLAVREVRRSSRPSMLVSRVLCIGVLLGFPVVAATMTLAQHTGWRGPELAAVMLLSAVCCLLALWQARAAMAVRRPAVLMLLAVSAISLATAMGLAAIYAAGLYLGTHWLEIAVMLPTHGVLQAIGFAFCGLLAWHAATDNRSGERGA